MVATVALTITACPLFGHAETLKKYATACHTVEQLEDIVANRNDRDYVMRMAFSGKCVMLLSDSVVHVKVVKGVFGTVKIKMRWGDKDFIGYTDSSNLLPDN